MYKIVITLHQIQAFIHRRREITLLTCSQLPVQLLPHSRVSSQPIWLLNPLNISIPCRRELISPEVLWPPMTLVHFFHNLILNVEISAIQKTNHKQDQRREKQGQLPWTRSSSVFRSALRISPVSLAGPFQGIHSKSAKRLTYGSSTSSIGTASW
jgi:hypothetical protein